MDVSIGTPFDPSICCKGFSCVDKEYVFGYIGNSICLSCGIPCSAHEMTVSLSKTSDNYTAVFLSTIIALRNARNCLSYCIRSLVKTSQYKSHAATRDLLIQTKCSVWLDKLNSVAKKLPKNISTVSNITKECSLAISLVKKLLTFKRKRESHPLSSTTSSQLCIKTLIALDQLYFWTYYSLRNLRKSKLCTFNKAVLPELEPFRFFSKLLFCHEQSQPIPKQMNKFPEIMKAVYSNLQQSDPTIKRNLLLRYFIVRWHETVSLGPFLKQRGGPVSIHKELQHPTMKKGVLCSQLLSEWRDSIRDFGCHIYSYAIPTNSVLEEMEKYSPLIEMGCGTGYWTKLLRDRKVHVDAFDSSPLTKNAQEMEQGAVYNEYHGCSRAFTDIQFGNEFTLEKLDSVDSSLFLCYPPPGCSMAVDCLEAFKGNTFLYAGEWSGDTGDSVLQRALLNKWVLVRVMPLPNWGNTCYSFMVWKRKEDRNDGECQPLLKELGGACFICEKTSGLLKCSVSSAIAVCGNECLELAKDRLMFERCIRNSQLFKKVNNIEISDFISLSK